MKQSLLTLSLLLTFITGAYAQTGEINRILKERSGQYKIDVIQSLLEQGLDTPDEDNRSSLMIAARYRYADLVKALIEAGADLNLQSKGGLTALMEASTGRENDPDTKIATMLIEAGADVNIKSNDGETSLLYITYYNEPELVKLLIDKGADLSAVSRFGDTPLSRAAHNEEVTTLLKEAGAGNVNPFDGIKDIATEGLLRILKEKPYTMGMQAIVKLLEQGINAQDDEGRTALILTILDDGNDFDSKPDHDELAPTIRPTGTGNIPFAKELIAMGADVNLGTKKGYTPLINAVKSRNKEMVKTLLAAKADINKVDKEGFPPLFYAICYQDMDMLNFLLDAGADPEVKEQFGNTMLHIAASDKNLPTAKPLLEKGVKTNVKNEDGMTPLMFAATPENITLLLQYKADINAVDNHGRTALMLFVQQGKTNLAKALIEHKADINATDKEGKSTLQYARSGEMRKILQDAGAR